MLIRRSIAALLIAAFAIPAAAGAAERRGVAVGDTSGVVIDLAHPKRGKGRIDIEVRAELPSAATIQRRLEAPAQKTLRRSERVTVHEFKRRPELRRAAPSIDIQAINFAFASANIPYSQYGKVEVIADAISRLLDRRPDAQVLIEGHTDAVGSYATNDRLSEARAASLKYVLVREFGIPSYAIETVGYGENYLLVPTYDEEWRNRRVTLRRIDEFVRH
jgi:outer membrane protein OmpA-like peptidoglycan-associated protein